MIDRNFISSIAERDIDLLMLEELSACDEFREWFCSRVYQRAVYSSHGGAWHSVDDAELGESDLVYLFTAASTAQVAILIENKVDAPPQPDQAKRYRLRGAKGKDRSWWNEFKTCLIAPSAYLVSAKSTELYDAEISYEELLSYFSSRRFRDQRFKYKADVIREAIEKNRRGYQPIISEVMTKYVQCYCQLANQSYPGLHVQEAKPRPAGNTWIMFNPEGMPDNLQVCHQLTAGAVKVFFKAIEHPLEAVMATYEIAAASLHAEIALAGKSVSLSIPVDRIDPLVEPFAPDVVLKALAALNSLIDMVREKSNGI